MQVQFSDYSLISQVSAKLYTACKTMTILFENNSSLCLLKFQQILNFVPTTEWYSDWQVISKKFSHDILFTGWDYKIVTFYKTCKFKNLLA